MMRYCFAFLCLAAGLSGCTMLGGDLIVRVSGTIPVDEPRQAGDHCRLDVVSVETGRRTPSHGVPENFSTFVMVVVDPQPKPHYFVVECDGGVEYRSREVMIGSRSKDFELGMLNEVNK